MGADGVSDGEIRANQGPGPVGSGFFQVSFKFVEFVDIAELQCL